MRSKLATEGQQSLILGAEDSCEKIASQEAGEVEESQVMKKQVPGRSEEHNVPKVIRTAR